MPFTFKLSQRLARMRLRVLILAAAAALACDQAARFPTSPSVPSFATSVPTETVFADDFESAALAASQAGGDPTREKVVTDTNGAQRGRHYLAVTYPAGSDGGWL